MHYAYQLDGGSTLDAAEDPRLASIMCGGPWAYSLDGAGVLITRPGAPRTLESYGQPQPVDGVDGLTFLPPLGKVTLYDYGRPDVHGGADVRLACGLTVSIPVALVQHRQLILGGKRPTTGDPVTEYGRTAAQLHARALADGSVPIDDPALGRLMVLALAQHYAVTAQMLDLLAVLSVDDVDPILGAVWCGDPKALAPESADAGKPLPISASTGA